MTSWRLLVRDPTHGRQEVVVDAELESSTATLDAQIEAAGFHEKPVRVDGLTLLGVDTVGELGMVHGSTITLGDVVPDTPPAPGAYLVAVSGPDCGGRWRLESGLPVTVGRNAGNDISFPDPLLSGRHASLAFDGEAVEVTDLGSRNGTYVEGVRLEEPERVALGTYITVGSTVMTVVAVDAADVAVLSAPHGPTYAFARQFRPSQKPLPLRIDPPREPTEGDVRRRNPWLRALLPLVTGVGFALYTGRWYFLAIMAVSPIVYAVDQHRERKARAAKVEADLEDYHREASAHGQTVAATRSEDRRRARDAAWCGGIATLFAEMRHARLWERTPTDDDFGSVCVGLAAQPSRIDGGPGLTADDWGVPLSVPLRQIGSTAVVGPIERARAVVRSMLMSLAATHAPSDVAITILTSGDAAGPWGFARWLPHTFEGTHGARIAVTEGDRAAQMKWIKQVIDTRAEDDRRESTPLPLHVVVFDGVGLFGPAELAEVLGRGPGQGVIGITIDTAMVPEGTQGRVTVGATAEAGGYQSRDHALIEDVVLAEMSPLAADAAARRLAGLLPSAMDDPSGETGVVHLTELLDLDGIDGTDVANRWRELSPRTSSVIGVASDTPMTVDIDKDGPHGLVGGTSGSGKTEFLKTLLVSLCLNNHPDDLSIVIVDFKGGVDHEHSKLLPHVIDVATNLDPDLFVRTIQLLDAEQERRQALFSSVGAANLDAYRSAREADPTLPPIPRLLVIVDEFGQLLASEGGKEQLKELEGLTRIGRALGVHLLLVTQNFENALPAQIDANAGLRICLRVQKPAHSKVVLDSAAAATISDSKIGRAFSRIRGRDLVEFQTARVAGRRRDLAAAAPAVTVGLVPFGALAGVGPSSRIEDPPAHESDMWMLIEAITSAAEATGWTESAVPWPSSLAATVGFADLARDAPPGEIPIGLADEPEWQRQTVATLDERVEQLLFLGGGDAALPDVLTNYAMSLALLCSPDDLHIYAIDLLGRGVGRLASLPHTGAVVSRNDAMGLRLLQWLGQTAAARRSIYSSSGASTLWDHCDVTGTEMPPRIVLIVNGAERLLMSGEAQTSPLLGPLLALLSESVGTGIQIVVAGAPSVGHNRLGTGITRRFVFNVSDRSETQALGVPRALAAELSVPRRAVDVARGLVVQFADFGDEDRSEREVLDAAVGALQTRFEGALRRPPHRFVEVPWPMPMVVAPPLDPRPDGYLRPVPVGVDTETGQWLWIDAEEDGPVLGVAGPAKSGRSSTLVALGQLAAQEGWRVIAAPASNRSPLARPDTHSFEIHQPAGLATLVEQAAADEALFVLVDDAARLAEDAPLGDVIGRDGPTVLVLAGTPDFLGTRVGVMRSVQMSAGVVISPGSSSDGAAFGLRRTPLDPGLPRAGRGLLIVAGEAFPVQIPHV